LKDEGLKYIADGLLDNDTLRVITLQNLGLSAAAIPSLSQCL